MKTIIFSFFLLAAGSSYAQQNKEAELARAAAANDLPLVKQLVEKKAADVNARLQISENVFLPLIVKTVMEDQTAISKYLIEQGANINEPDGFGMTCLMWAAFNGNAELVTFLLQKGADKGAETENGMTALKAAKEQGHKEIVKLLK